MRTVPTTWARWGLLALVAAASCSRPVEPSDSEEVETPLSEVPAAVQVTAARLNERMGGTRCEAWFWDTESLDWECRLTGLDRQAELDIRPDGTFSELELVYTLDEVEAALPDTAAFIRRQCRDQPGTFIELSLRREGLLEPIPDLAEAWTRSGVALEFQCSNGRDFTIDARHHVEEQPADDVGDASQGGEGGR